MSTTNGSIGHNSELTPEERRALFFDHYRKIARQNEKVKAERATLKELRQTAKADGIVLADVDFALRCAEVEDPGIVVDELKRRTEIAAWFALPVDFQPDLFGDDRIPAEDKAYDEGRLASATGKPGKPPHDPSVPQYQAWLRGYNDDQQRLREALKQAMIKKNAEKKARAVADADADDEEDEDERDDEAAEGDAQPIGDLAEEVVGKTARGRKAKQPAHAPAE